MTSYQITLNLEVAIFYFNFFIHELYLSLKQLINRIISKYY